MVAQQGIDNLAQSATNAITVHAIKTGSVRVRRNQVRGKGVGVRRMINTFFDRQWTDWLPIYAWVIDHPEGLIAVDTGETARTGAPGYLPGWHPYYRNGVQFRVEPEDEIGPQLRNRWINPEDVRWVLMSHLHTDHAGGLHHFPNSEIVAHRNAFEQAQGLPGRVRGFLPNRWPTWFKPTLVEFDNSALGPFPKSLPITSAGDVSLVPTPGHTSDHLSVVVQAPDITYFLAGDSSYSQELMLTGSVDGLAPDERIAKDTLERIRMLATDQSLVYLPSHDPQSACRLENREIVNVVDRFDS